MVETFSPNQLEKRQQIIDAARQVLAQHGLMACTARAIADASPLTKSAIHYYFTDMDEIIDAAMAWHIDAFVQRLRSVAARYKAPPDRFWAVVGDYLACFEETPNAATLWLEYWIDSVRRGRPRAMKRTVEPVLEFLETVFEGLQTRDAAAKAHALLSYLLGTIVQQQVHKLSFDALRPEVIALLRLPPEFTR